MKKKSRAAKPAKPTTPATHATPERQQQVNRMFQQATRAHQTGQLETAIHLYQQVVQLAPRHTDALHLLGMAHAQQEDYRRAITFFRKAVSLRDDNPTYHNNLGEAYRRNDEPAQAIKSYRQAIRLKPAFAEAHYNLANVYKTEDRLEDAIKHYQEAIRIKPDYPKAYYNMGNTLMGQARYEDAIRIYEQVLVLDPNFADAYNNIGNAHREQKDYDKAIQSYQHCLKLNPESTEAHRNMGLTLEAINDIDGARYAYERVLAIQPDNELLRLHTETLCQPIAMSNQQIDTYRAELVATLQRIAGRNLRAPHEGVMHGQPHFSLTYQGRDERPIKEQWAALFSDVIPTRTPRRVNRTKPHIGFVVTHGHEGIFTKCMQGILNHWPKTRFVLSIVCSGQKGEDALRPAITNPDIHYVRLPDGFDKAIDTIWDARFDLLYHWEIASDATNYFLPFYGLAPIQCTSWGIPVTSGIPQMDYFLSTEAMETDESDSHYTETLVRMKHLPPYYYRAEIPTPVKPRSHFGLPDDKNLYVCFQNLRKVHPDMDRMLGAILRRDPQGIVVFVGDRHPLVASQLRQRFQATLPDVVDRVRFIPRMPVDDYLCLNAQANVVLDTLYYNGANTSYDTFAAGTPLVTHPTRYQRGRFSAAAYWLMGVTDCIASSPDEYVDLAVRFGTDPVERERVGRAIAEASKGLFEEMGAVTQMVDFCEAAVEQTR